MTFTHEFEAPLFGGDAHVTLEGELTDSDLRFLRGFVSINRPEWSIERHLEGGDIETVLGPNLLAVMKSDIRPAIVSGQT